MASTLSRRNLVQSLSMAVVLSEAHLRKPVLTPWRNASTKRRRLMPCSGPTASSMPCTNCSANAVHSCVDIWSRGRSFQPSTKPVIRNLMYSLIRSVAIGLTSGGRWANRKTSSRDIAATDSTLRACCSSASCVFPVPPGSDIVSSLRRELSRSSEAHSSWSSATEKSHIAASGGMRFHATCSCYQGQGQRSNKAL